MKMEATVDPQPPGSRLDADHPENGVLIPRRNTGCGPMCATTGLLPVPTRRRRRFTLRQ